MNFITLCACIVSIFFLLLWPTVSVLNHTISKRELIYPVSEADDFAKLSAYFHSALFPPIDLLADPVENYLKRHRGFITPFTEFSPSDQPDNIICCPPFSEMVVQAEIYGVLQSKQEDLTKYTQFTLERFFQHLIFSFVVNKYQQSKDNVKSHGPMEFPQYASSKNSSIFHDRKLTSMTGDRCADLLLLSPDFSDTNSFSFVASNPGHSFKGVERVIRSTDQNLEITTRLAVGALKNLHASLRQHYKQARMRDDNPDEAIYLAELTETLVHLTKTGRIHATEENKLHAPAEGVIDNRCFLWLPREAESWSFINDVRNQTGIYSFGVDQSSFLAGIQSETIQAFDYGDQVEMLDVLPIGSPNASGHLLKDTFAFENNYAEVLFDYLKLTRSLKEFRRMTDECWHAIQKFARETKKLSCKENTHRSSSGLCGNFCYSGPPSAPLRILLSKKYQNLLDEDAEKINEEMRAQYVSELNSPTLELMGYIFEKVSLSNENLVCKEDLTLEQPSLNVLRRQGACNIQMPETLRDKIIGIWRKGMRELKASEKHNAEVDPLDAASNQREFMKRLSRFELVCPCRMSIKRPKSESKSRFFP